MRKHIFQVVSIVAVLLVGAILFYNNQNKTEEFLARNNLQEMSVVEIVEYLEDKTDEPVGFQAGITSTKLLLSDEKDSVEMDLPSDLFYLSMAPYINQTHPCGTHNLVTCRGELQNVTLYVVVSDVSTNEVVLNEEVNTYANGFAGLWLPRERNLSITVTYDNLSSTTEVSTFEVDNTCETTLRLV